MLNAGLPCFPFPRAWKIALSGEFSSWLVISGNALFLRVSLGVNTKSQKKFHLLFTFCWQFGIHVLD